MAMPLPPLAHNGQIATRTRTMLQNSFAKGFMPSSRSIESWVEIDAATVLPGIVLVIR